MTSLHRTLLDFAEVARYQQLRLALDAAERLELLDLRKLEPLYDRARGRHGLKPLKATVADVRGPAPWTQSELERRFHALIREWGLREPQTNVIVEGYLVDFWWPESRLVVELDGYRFHKDRRTFESDRRRDTKLQLANCMTLRVTQARIENEPRELMSDVIRGPNRLGGGAASDR